jgi:hypothetical protein
LHLFLFIVVFSIIFHKKWIKPIWRMCLSISLNLLQICRKFNPLISW